MDKKPSLLMVLDHPEITLHNNPAELGARKRVRKRVVSFGTRTDDGTKAWDTFIYDRISGALKIPNLADVIAQRSKEFDLTASWDTSP